MAPVHSTAQGKEKCEPGVLDSHDACGHFVLMCQTPTDADCLSGKKKKEKWGRNSSRNVPSLFPHTIGWLVLQAARSSPVARMESATEAVTRALITIIAAVPYQPANSAETTLE